MILSVRCDETQALFVGGRSRRFASIARVAMRRLGALDAAQELRDLRSPQGNFLEALKGDRAGQHSIRTNSAFVSPGAAVMPSRWRLWTTTDGAPT